MIERLHELIKNTSANHAISSSIVEVPGDHLNQEPVAWVPDSPPGTPLAITRRTSTMACPECSAVIPRKGLTPDEAQRVRVALMKLASSSVSCLEREKRLLLLCSRKNWLLLTPTLVHHAIQTLEACRHLQHFSEWLCQRPEYSIVLDGANVAYNGHQVRGQYVFKYHQVRGCVSKRLFAFFFRPDL